MVDVGWTLAQLYNEHKTYTFRFRNKCLHLNAHSRRDLPGEAEVDDFDSRGVRLAAHHVLRLQVQMGYLLTM